MAAANQITIDEAREPTVETDGKVQELRGKGIDFVTAARIGGMCGNAVRRQELGLKVTPSAAAKQLAQWRSLRKWRTKRGEETLATAFQFGIAACVRPTAVLERGTVPGTILDPIKVYAMRDGASLRRSQEKAGNPSTIPFWNGMPFVDLLQHLSADSSSFCVVLFDRNELHYSPFVLPPPTLVVYADEALDAMEDQEIASLLDADLEEQAPAPAPAPPPTVVAEGADDVGNLQEVEGDLESCDEASLEPETPRLTKRDVSHQVAASRRSERSQKRVRMSFPMPPTRPLPKAGPQVDDETALDVSGIVVGQELLALGLAANGRREWFQARVIGLRPKFPPIVVKVYKKIRAPPPPPLSLSLSLPLTPSHSLSLPLTPYEPQFTKTLDGNSMALLLPRPNSAYIMKAETKRLD